LIRASINLREKLFRRRSITGGNTKPGDDDRVAQGFFATRNVIRSEDVAAVRRQYDFADTPM
jgi:hypothetical protein